MLERIDAFLPEGTNDLSTGLSPDTPLVLHSTLEIHSESPEVLVRPRSHYQFDEGFYNPCLLDKNEQPYKSDITNNNTSAEFEPSDKTAYVKALWIPTDKSEPVWVTAPFDRSSNDEVFFTEQAAKYKARQIWQRLWKYQDKGYQCPEDTGRDLVQILDTANTHDKDDLLDWEELLKDAINTGDQLELGYADTQPIRAEWIGADLSRLFKDNPDKIQDHLEEAGFNSYAVTYYHNSTGMEDFVSRKGKRRFDSRDVVINRILEMDAKAFIRPFVWNHSCVTPEYVADMNFEKFMDYSYYQAADIIDHYTDMEKQKNKKIVAGYEIINEAPWANIQGFSNDQVAELTTMLCNLTAERHPEALRILNATAPWGHYAIGERTEDGRIVENQQTPYQYYEDTIKRGVPFDITGIQLYTEYHSLADTVQLVERFESLGKPVYITEFGIRAGKDKHHWWKGWDRKLQEKWVVNTYKVLLPRVYGISYYDAGGDWLFENPGGLHYKLGSETPALKGINTLLKSKNWNPKLHQDNGFAANGKVPQEVPFST